MRENGNEAKPVYEIPHSHNVEQRLVRAIYLDGDEVFGQWSDVVSIAVTG